MSSDMTQVVGGALAMQPSSTSPFLTQIYRDSYGVAPLISTSIGSYHNKNKIIKQKQKSSQLIASKCFRMPRKGSGH